MNRRVLLAALAGMPFGGHQVLAAVRRASSGPPPSEMPSAMDLALRSAWRDVERPPPGDPSIAIQWSAMRTPLLPLSWPPDGRTVWVSHLYASGFDPRLSDAVRLAAPWGRLRIDRDPLVPVFEPGSGRVEEIGIQGSFMVVPDAAGKAGEAEAAAAVLTWTAEPSEAPGIRAFYRDWAYWNGVIRGVVADGHAGFFAWLCA
jgi:hypothetical protein